MDATAVTARSGWMPGLRRRVAAWAKRRQGEERFPLTINTRRIYILPTRGGCAFAALLFIMLIAGLNYSNSIALLITFLLAGFALIAMHLCHRNLSGTVVRGIATIDAFVGVNMLAWVDRGEQRRHRAHRPGMPGCGLRTRGAEPGRRHRGARRTGGAAPDSGQDQSRAHQTIDGVSVRAFSRLTWLHPSVSLLAWPAPRGRREPPVETASGGSSPAVHHAGDEEWAGLRAFRDGDSPRQVAWAAYARGRGLLVKTYQSPAAHHRTFDLATTPGAGVEQRLEQLAAWIVAAHARGERYGCASTDVKPPPTAATNIVRAA